MPYNSETLLPQPSILAKLKELDANAPETIMASAEALAAARRETEMKLVNRFSRAAKTGWKDLLNTMIIYPGPGSFDMPSPERQDMYDQALAQSAQDAISSDWARVGDSMRLAIRGYMDQNNLTEDTLNLTEQERASMVLAFPAPAARTAETGFFRKIFPKL